MRTTRTTPAAVADRLDILICMYAIKHHVLHPSHGMLPTVETQSFLTKAATAAETRKHRRMVATPTSPGVPIVQSSSSDDTRI
jgi:hypothetical protein